MYFLFVCFSFFSVFVLQDKVRVELFLAAAHMGVLVFQDGSKINTFLIFMLAG